MDPSTIGMIGFVVALILLLFRVPIGFTLTAVASTCALVAYSWRPGFDFNLVRGWKPALGLIESAAFDFVHSYSLSMIPMFIAAGHIAYHARITTDIYDSVRVFLSKVPGGLAIASIIGCGGFSAITGSSVACASSMGRICVPEMLRYNYSPQLATSAVAAGGTMGSLIPPSVLFIVYGIFTETSISRLFLAGVIPGILSVLGFIITVVIWVKLRPEVAPKAEGSFSTSEKIEAMVKAWPAAMLMFIIIGGIYGGFFTATEAAAVSLAFVLIFGFVTRRLNWANVMESMRETAHSSASLFFIAVGAKIFVAFVSLTGVTHVLVDMVSNAGLPNWAVLLCLVAMYLVMGMFLDPLGTMLLTLPFVVPLIEGMGYDLIWFGVIVIKLLEIGLVTPPVGLNVFVISSVVGREIQVTTIFFGVVRFLVLDVVVLLLLLFIPALSLFLPNTMF
ncbi:TRAP transporter, DctM subunit [Thalassovita litoralis]|jgi:tripartite ATP-independent transporter DctM subunit|uniref:TRAP transporter large permease protein n=1 Tax=Thalassovita litoralis TaxID=1010611 RepID=A0A521ENP4_9RHOB|nr:TRAP transporter large permease [Thalassovita litoralis]SMO85533.1 TRAP transporter, DctM subunit [Thalassovita litoralis]